MFLLLNHTCFDDLLEVRQLLKLPVFDGWEVFIGGVPDGGVVNVYAAFVHVDVVFAGDDGVVVRDSVPIRCIHVFGLEEVGQCYGGQIRKIFTNLRLTAVGLFIRNLASKLSLSPSISFFFLELETWILETLLLWRDIGVLVWSSILLTPTSLFPSTLSISIKSHSNSYLY